MDKFFPAGEGLKCTKMDLSRKLKVGLRVISALYIEDGGCEDAVWNIGQ